jgi:divinyl protochlorophyllide a 8-vinyl-reductase
VSAPAVTVGASRIGPNAVTRVAEALVARFGAGAADPVFAAAGLRRHLAAPPQDMVDEREVAALHRALRDHLGADADAVARDAGVRTARYLLARRIPKPVQALLRLLPASAAQAVLLRAIARHAWTFTGSGRLEVRPGHPVRLALHDNPLCRGVRAAHPVCHYHAAVFETLFRELVHPDTRVVETACEAAGGDACRFELRWR